MGESERLDRLEAIARAYGLHEPTCPAYERMQAQSRSGAYFLPAPCTCWLNDDRYRPEDDDA